MWLFLFWCAVLGVTATLYFKQKYSIFKKRGLKYATPVPLFGSLLPVVFGLEHANECVRKNFVKFPNERFFGYFEFLKPVVFIRDLDLIKDITIKDCDYFTDHRTVVDDKIDPFWGRNLLSLKGQEWKNMRATLSPAFTSSKIRHMVPFMTEAGEHTVQSIKRKLSGSRSPYTIVDTKDLTTRYANDVIASCAFGLMVDSHAEPNNIFYVNSFNAAAFKLKQVLVFFANSSFPWLVKFFKVSIFDKSTSDFFSRLLIDTMKTREEEKIIRPDMVHLLIEAKNGKLTHDDNIKDTNVGFATVEESDVGKRKTNSKWSENDLIAQAMTFILGGFETSSNIMTFALYELAVNPDVQDKLAKEIREYHEKNNGHLDFNTLQSMVYMDMVVSETLRLWTPGFFVERLCVRDYNMGKPNKDSKEDYVIRKGESIMIPIWCIHRDEKYYTNPNKFDPDRFSEGNKANIKPLTYMPFGVGPRNCIGSRFALCEFKIILYQILLAFEVSPTEKTVIPPEIIPRSFSPRLKGGHELKFTLRKS